MVADNDVDNCDADAAASDSGVSLDHADYTEYENARAMESAADRVGHITCKRSLRMRLALRRTAWLADGCTPHI